MKLLLNGQFNGLTLIIILMEFALLVTQLFYFLSMPEDKPRLWYMILLALLILFNISNGLFPDLALPLGLKVQNIAVIGFGYLVGAYIPYYFYKAYELCTLRFFATWGVILFLILPYLAFVVAYAINGNLVTDREWSVLVPGIFGIVVMVNILRAIRIRFKQTGNKGSYRCQLLVWAAVIPWELMSLLAFFSVAVELKIVLGNLGWIAISLIQFRNAIRYYKIERESYKVRPEDINWDDFRANAQYYELSQRERDVAELKLRGLERRAIADKLFISLHTVKTHINHIYEKTDAGSAGEVVRKLTMHRFK